MSFRICGIDPAPFRPLYGLSDAELVRRGARRLRVDTCPGFPDRVELRDLEPGESALLVNHMHQPAATPFRASHAIFVREGAEQAAIRVGEVPEAMRIRPLSLRAFDRDDMMVEGELVDGAQAAALIAAWFERPDISYLHAHYARRGCFAARVERV